MAKRKSHDEGGGGSWLDTYADMVTLLLTFFVMLFAMSSVNEEKWEQLVRAFARKGQDTAQVVIAPEGEGDDVGRNQSEFPPPGGEADLETQSNLPKNFNQLYEYLKSYIDENNMGASVSVEESEGSVFIRFHDNLFFDPDKFNLKPASYDILNFLGDGLKNLQDQILTVNISGHTAAVPLIEDYPISDWMLSSERASAVAIYLEEEKGLDPAILLPIGYGKNHPVADNDTPEGRERNRRVDMLIVSKESDADHQKLLQQILEGTYDPNQYPQNGGVSGVLLPEEALENLPKEAPTENPAPGEVDASSVSSSPEGQADGNNPGEEGASAPVEAGSEPAAAPEPIN